jgi:hypothetical protein
MLKATFIFFGMRNAYIHWVLTYNKHTLENEYIYNGEVIISCKIKETDPTEGAQQRRDSKTQTALISGRKSQGGLDAKTY